MVRLNMGALPRKVKTVPERRRRPAWYKASEEQQALYSENLQRRIQTVPVPDCLWCQDLQCRDPAHSEERDGFVLNLMGAVIESSHATLPMVGGRGRPGGKQDSGCVPGWKEEVAPQRKDSMFWHSVWLSAGRPTHGHLYDIMKRTRNKYHQILRQVRRAADRIKSQKLFEASMWGGGDLFEELKKTRGGKFSPDLPETVAGANGEAEIAKKFQQVYRDLYNSAESSENMEVIKGRVEAKAGQEGMEEVEKITLETVKVAAGMMKKGKADVSGSYTSDAIRNAPDCLYGHLASVFRSWLVHGTVCRPLLACAFQPLLKNALKDPASTKSYRAIAGSATVLMLFDRLILNLWGDRIASGSLQMGYKRGSSTAQCSYLVSETVSHFLREGSNPLLVALDMTMAFDMCRFDVLFGKIEAKLPAIIVRTLIFVYQQQYAWVRWGNTQSEVFGIANSTRQGSVLSPALFTVYIQELLDRLQAAGVGCFMGNTYVGAVAWADDLLLTSPSRSAMQHMLDIASSYAGEVGLQYSTDPVPAKSKSKACYVVGRRTGLQKPAPLLLSGGVLPYVEHLTHLGHEFHQSGTMDMDTKMHRGSFIGRCLEVQEAFAFAAPEEILSAVRLYCCDLYGGMLARLRGGPAQQLMNCWTTTVKDVWGLPRSTHTIYARWLGAAHVTIKEDLLSRWVKFYQSLLTGPSPEVAIVARMAAADVRSSTADNNRLILETTGLQAGAARPREVREELRRRDRQMTDEERATAGELCRLLELRAELHRRTANTDIITREINTLASD
jgi:hypothetical protein